MSETDTIAQAAPDAPAAGDTPTTAEAALAAQRTETKAEPAKAESQTAGEDDAGDDEGQGKKPSRSQRLQRKVQLLTSELEGFRRAGLN